VSRNVASCFVRFLRRRKGDSLSCLVFNLALEKIKRDSGIESKRSKTKYKIVEENINDKTVELYVEIMDYKLGRVYEFTPGITSQ
jgi:hypothetical protein